MPLLGVSSVVSGAVLHCPVKCLCPMLTLASTILALALLPGQSSGAP